MLCARPISPRQTLEPCRRLYHGLRNVSVLPRAWRRQRSGGMMKYTHNLPFVLTVFLPVSAMAANVYPGCSVPSLKTGHHTFYVDPVNGSMSGDGSSAKPWKTLTEVLNPANKLISTQGHAGTAYTNGTDTALHAVNPNGPVKAGDLILLKAAIMELRPSSTCTTPTSSPSRLLRVRRQSLVGWLS